MFVGALRVDLLLGDVRSLKQKRGAVRPVLAGLRRHLDVAAAETAHHDLLRRTEVGLSTVSGDASRVEQVLDDAERWLWSRTELEVVGVQRWVRSVDD